MTVVEPELPAFLLSPPYEATIVTAPTDVPFTVTEHDPEVRVHVEEEKETEPAPLIDQVIVPVGVPDPLTVALQLLVAFTAKEDGAQLTIVEEVALLLTVKLAVPELPWLLVSPLKKAVIWCVPDPTADGV